MNADDTVARVQLLVSVMNADEARSAMKGGAHLVDAKDSHAGALGAVALAEFRAIHAVAAASRLVTAAIGDASDESAIERTAFEYAEAGAVLVKAGFAGIADPACLAALAAAAHRGALAGGRGRSAIVLVAYADQASRLAPAALADIAARSGARAVLLDTADKNAPGLRSLVDQRSLAAWVAYAHDCGLLVAVAGKLGPADLPFVRDAGADIAGVRGAACDGGRTGRVSAARVLALRALCQEGARYNAALSASI